MSSPVSPEEQGALFESAEFDVSIDQYAKDITRSYQPSDVSHMEALAGALQEAAEYLDDPDKIEDILADEQNLREVRKQRNRLVNKMRSGSATSDEVIEWFHTFDPLQDSAKESLFLQALTPGIDIKEKSRELKVPDLVRGANILLQEVITENMVAKTDDKADQDDEFDSYLGRHLENPAFRNRPYDVLLERAHTVIRDSGRLLVNTRTTELIGTTAQIMKVCELLNTSSDMDSWQINGREMQETMEAAMHQRFISRAVFNQTAAILFALEYDVGTLLIDKHPELLAPMLENRKFELYNEFMHVMSVARMQTGKEAYLGRMRRVEHLFGMKGMVDSIDDETWKAMTEEFSQDLYYLAGTGFDLDLLDKPLDEAMFTQAGREIIEVLQDIQEIYSPETAQAYETAADNNISGFMHELLWQIDLYMAQILQDEFICFPMPAFSFQDRPLLNRPVAKRGFDVAVSGLFGSELFLVQLKSSKKAARKAKNSYHPLITLVAEGEVDFTDTAWLDNRLTAYKAFFDSPTEETAARAYEMLLPSVVSFIETKGDKLGKPEISADKYYDGMAIAKALAKVHRKGFESGYRGKKSKRGGAIAPLHKGRVTISPKVLMRQMFEEALQQGNEQSGS